MKVFLFLFAAFFIGSSAAQSNETISVEVERFLNASEAAVNAVVNVFVHDIQFKVEIASNVTNAAWRIFRPILTALVDSTNSRNFISQVEAALNATAQAFLSDFSGGSLRDRISTFFDTATVQLVAQVQDIAGALQNASIDAYQCWNASKAEVETALNTFVETTRNQTQPILENYANAVESALEKVIGNFSTYQIGITASCWWPFTAVRCRINYVSFKFKRLRS